MLQGSRGRILTAVTAFAVVLALALLQRQGTEEPAPPEAQSGEPEADAEIEGVRLRQRQGDERWSLRADHAAHFPDKGYTHLRTVRLTVERKEGNPLRARSRTGRIEDGSREITLQGDVEIVDPGGYRMTTETLHYIPAKSRAETRKAVRIVADFGEATGTGATLWTRKDRVRLHRNAVTTFWRSPGDAS